MPELTESHRFVLAAAPRAIAHLRKQISLGRFGFMFGSGISAAFLVPTWDELVDAIASDKRVDGRLLMDLVAPRAGLPYRTEMLFEHYRKRRYGALPIAQHHTRRADFEIGADWREIVREHLYAKMPADFPSAFTSHPYLGQCLPLIRKSHMTVTYNFDNFLEQALALTRDPEERTSSRGYESVTNPWMQFRRQYAIIYHPNGVVPENAFETPSDRFVFSEGSYAEQLMGIFAGDHAGLLNHLSKTTCLMIGLSLEDETLRSLLMHSARTNPGNYHYYVHYLPPKSDLDEGERHAITRANFKVYNLVTLFLNDQHIRSLVELIDTEHCSSEDYCDFCAKHGIEKQFRFFLTGALGVGKSTTLNHFRNLFVIDEWVEERPPILAKAWETLNDGEREFIDSWISRQFRMKNDTLRRGTEGVFMLDRGPLDPLAFTPDLLWSSKAGRLLNAICPGHAQWEVEPGRVIFLTGDPAELSLRMVISQRESYTCERLQLMEADLRDAYGLEGIVTVDTIGHSPADVARRVAEIVHLESYEPVCNLHERLREIEFGGRPMEMPLPL